MTAWVIALLALLPWGAGDRIIGKGALGHTTPGAVIALTMTGWAFWVLHMPWHAALAMGLVWMFYRVWMGFGEIGDSINAAPKQLPMTAVRHAYTFLYLAPAWLAHLKLGPVALGMGLYAVLAAVLSFINYEAEARQNGAIEISRGVLLWIVVVWSFVLAQ